MVTLYCAESSLSEKNQQASSISHQKLQHASYPMSPIAFILLYPTLDLFSSSFTMLNRFLILLPYYVTRKRISSNLFQGALSKIKVNKYVCNDFMQHKKEIRSITLAKKRQEYPLVM